jgi:hypothetical protein
VTKGWTYYIGPKQKDDFENRRTRLPNLEWLRIQYFSRPVNNRLVVFEREEWTKTKEAQSWLKIWGAEYELLEVCCHCCEYYYKGICNAGKVPTKNNLEPTTCPDFEQVNYERRRKSNEELEKKIIVIDESTSQK